MMTGFTVETILNLSPAQNNQYRWEDTLLACALKIEEAGKPLNFVGPFAADGAVLPKRGSKVRIKKGTVITGTFPDSKRDGVTATGIPGRVAKRTYTVTLHDCFRGYVDHYAKNGPYVQNPQVVFTDTNGYWCYVPLEEVEVVG